MKLLRQMASLVLTFIIISPCCAQDDPETPEIGSLFGLESVTDIHIDMSAAEWEKLQPPPDTNWDIEAVLQRIGQDAVEGKNFRSEPSARAGLAGYMGVNHQYGRANVTIGDVEVADVGVRYKGNGTFIAGYVQGKPSFKIDFNEYREDEKFQGLTKINLNNNVTDPSYLREALSYELFLQAGIPAPRVGWAQVTVSVDGGEPKPLGLYSIVEQVDKRFLKRHYSSAKGLLLKQSTLGAFRYLGDEWEPYIEAYNPKTTGSPEQQARAIEFSRLIYQSSDEEFAASLNDFLDIDRFTTFLAMNVLLANMDSFLGGSQNYYAYLNPESNKFEILPWDLDHSFGAFILLGTPESRRDMSIDEPCIGDGSNRIIERFLEIEQLRDTYHQRLEELMGSVFREDVLKARIDAAGQFVRPLVPPEGRDAFDASMGTTPTTENPDVLKYFVEKRTESVREQLAGRSKGQTHSYGPSPAVVKAWITAGIVLAIALLLNVVAWIFAFVAGFRASNGWGVANMFLYPAAPLAFGFVVRRDLGMRSAVGVTIAAVTMVAVLIGAVAYVS